jgi:hypothetical protein
LKSLDYDVMYAGSRVLKVRFHVHMAGYTVHPEFAVFANEPLPSYS